MIWTRPASPGGSANSFAFGTISASSCCAYSVSSVSEYQTVSGGNVVVVMLTIRDLKMSVGGRTLFEKASLQVNYGERVALVGPNGAGKTTLFSILLKKQTPDEGVVERDEWTMIGYLPQEGEAVGDETV